MNERRIVFGLCCAMTLAVSGCSGQQSDWHRTRETNTAEAYEQFLKKYPNGEFTAQAQARARELYEERDWQKARDADTSEAYQAFIKQYPEGRWTEEARIRVENFTLAQLPSSSAMSAAGSAGEPASDVSGASAAGTSPAPAAATSSAPAATTSSAPAAKNTSTGAASAGSAVTSARSSGHYRVQLGAFKTGAAAAHQHWTDLKQEYPDLLAGLSSMVIPKKTAEGSLYRLLTSGLTEEHARHLCRVFRTKSEPCIVVPPAKS